MAIYSWFTSATGINDSGTIVGSAQDAPLHYFGFELIGGTFIKIEPLHPELSGANDLNNSGVITGFSKLHSGLIRSYLFRQGQFHQFEIPGAIGTTISGINDSNTTVGCYQDANNHTLGFVRRPRGQFVTLRFPGSKTTCALSINGAGTVVGYFTKLGDVLGHGFIWAPPVPVETK